MLVHTIEEKVKKMIDELKGVCMQAGLSNQAAEEQCVTTVLLYKFLDSKKDFLPEEYSIQSLIDYQKKLTRFFGAPNNPTSMSQFTRTFDRRISEIAYKIEETLTVSDPQNNVVYDPVMIPISALANQESRDIFVSNVFKIISNPDYDISEIVDEKHQFDFFSAVFEYMIHDYNVAAGVYAEYFTPQIISHIIGRILASMNDGKMKKNVSIYDPSAGTGSLVLHLDDALKKEGLDPAIYTQDISQKSTRFLKLNILLNGLYHDELHIAHGDTLLAPAHYEEERLKKFDIITSNPPFKVDFSSTRNEIAEAWADTDRFFAGIPNIPTKKKESMPIYLMFIQHIIYSMSESGKAAIVVPSSFLSARTSCETAIKEKMISDNLLAGIITMPARVFANTTTKVSVIFLDKNKCDDSVFLVDSSELGTLEKVGKTKRIVLSSEEVEQIIDFYINKTEQHQFSVSVTAAEIEENGYNLMAGQYFAPEFNFSPKSENDFRSELMDCLIRLDELELERRSIEEDCGEFMMELRNLYGGTGK